MSAEGSIWSCIQSQPNPETRSSEEQMSNNMEDYKLLHEEEDGWNGPVKRQRNFKKNLLTIAVPVSLSFAVIVFSVFLVVVTWDSLHYQKHSAVQLYTPVEDILEYVFKQQEDSLHTRTRYMANRSDGLPSVETDALWRSLYMSSMHTGITPLEASKLPQKTMKVPQDPSKYLIQLEFFHQIHCLDVIRRALYLPEVDRYKEEFDDYIAPNGKKNFKGHDAFHIDHCIDWIRQALLCSADVTPVIWAVDPKMNIPLPQLPPIKTCRNMNAIQNWVDERAVGQVDFGFGPDVD